MNRPETQSRATVTRVPRGPAKAAAAVAAVGIAAGALSFVTPVANAAPSDGRMHGSQIAGQGYGGKADGAPEWMGTYKFSGGEAWCVSFALMEPSRVEATGAKYVPAGVLKGKDGKALTEEEHAITSYAVAQGQRVLNDKKASKAEKNRYGQAVAFILHKYTAQHMPKGGNESSATVGYNSGLHDKAMSKDVRDLKNRLVTEGKAHPGPWTLEVVPANDKGLQVGKATEFKVSLKAANNKPIKQEVSLRGIDVDGVPATVELDDAGQATFSATPKAAAAKIEASTDAAPGKLKMLKPSTGNGQNIVVAGPHNIKSSTTELTATEFGAVVLTKITAGDTNRRPVEGAEVSIYKKEDLDKAGLTVTDTGITSGGATKPSEPTTSEAPATSESAAPSTSEAPAPSEEPQESEAPTSTTEAEEPRQDTVTPSEEPSFESEAPSTSAAPSTSESAAPSTSERKEMPKGVGFSTVDSSNVEKLEDASQATIDNLKAVKPVAVVTTANANALRGRMAPGEYVAVETKAPTGLALDAKPVKFTVETNKDAEVLLENTVKATLVKVDKATNAKLAGATYDINPCNSKEVVATLTTDSKGEAIFTLPQGCYQAVEKQAPEGYEMNDTPQQFELSREDTSVMVADVKKEAPAPRKVEKRVPVKEIPSGPTGMAPGSFPEVK